MIALILTALMVTGLCSCTVERAVQEKAEREEKNEKKTEDKESTADTDSESMFGEPSGTDKAYTFYSKNVLTEGDIQPIYDMADNSMLSLGVSEYLCNGEKYLIDFDGNKKVEVEADSDNHANFRFCSMCGEYTSHSESVDPITFDIVQNMSGHGGLYGYIIDEATGLKYVEAPDGAWPEEYWADCDVLPLAARRELTAEEIEYGVEYAYEYIGEYVLTVGDEIVVRDGCEYGICFDNAGIAALCKDGKWGYFNSEGEEILPFEYSPSAYSFTDYRTDGKIRYIPYSSSFGYIAVCKDGKWGYADTEGNMVTDLEFDEARPVYMGKAWVKLDGAWSVIEFAEYDEGITADEALEILTESYQDEGYIYFPDKDDCFYDTRSFCYVLTEPYGQYEYWVLYNGDIYSSASRNYIDMY